MSLRCRPLTVACCSAGWLDKNLTLQAQEVPEDPTLTLLFAREFFGEPLDQNDPFQLQLNFVQVPFILVFCSCVPSLISDH